jgi:AcrR family transcriptional regulator
MKKKRPNSLDIYRPQIPQDLVSSSAKNATLIEKKQKQIVDAACKLFFEKGFHGTNIREIAAESSMSMGQLYHYISSKDDILFLVYKHMQELWYEYLVDLGFEKVKDPLERLIKALRATIEFPAKNKKLFQFIFSETKYLGKKHLSVILDMDNRNVSGFFRKLLEEVKKDYSLEHDPDLAARFITFTGVFISLRGWNLKEWPEKDIVDFMARFILKGLDLPFDMID